ncbi:MAG: hypothetical protein ABIZ80_09860 [Bryobacteraceae bacterium]
MRSNKSSGRAQSGKRGKTRRKIARRSSDVRSILSPSMTRLALSPKIVAGSARWTAARACRQSSRCPSDSRAEASHSRCCNSFNSNEEIIGYRDTLADDFARLDRFLSKALEEGVILVPDGRMYVSAAHAERDVEETLARFARVFASL